MMSQVDALVKRFPGIDCGSCGAPSCQALAEDIVRGVAKESDCIHILREYIHRISGEISMLDRTCGDSAALERESGAEEVAAAADPREE